MKKILTFIGVFLVIGVLISCSNDEPSLLSNEKENDLKAEVFSTNPNLRTLEEAAEIVRSNLHLIGESGSRSGLGRTFSTKSAKMVVWHRPSRAELPDTLMYVFNFDNEEGFAVVAADRRLDGLIAITEKGCYDPDIESDNPGLAYYMSVAKASLKLKRDSLEFIGDSAEIIEEDPKLDNPGGGNGGNGGSGDGPITTLAQQRWEDDTIVIFNTGSRLGVFQVGQNYPEGMLCSNKTSGCSVTAMYMVMSYFGYPTQLYLDYDKNATEILNIDWPDLTNHRKSYSYLWNLNRDNCSAERHNTIAKICRYLGYHLDAKYGYVYDKDGNQYGSTSASPGKVYDVMKNFGYRVITIQNYDRYDAVGKFVMQNALVMLCVKISDDAAHMWIMDGYRSIKYIHRVFIKYDGDPTWYPNGENEYTSTMIHMNWGWNGAANGWYSSGVFNPGNVAIADAPGQGSVNSEDYYTNYSLRTEMNVTTVTR